MKKSTLDLTAIKMQSLINREQDYEYPQFLVELRKVLGRTKQAVTYELDWDYDELWRHETGKAAKKIDKEKIFELSEYYGIDAGILERKFREWSSVKKPTFSSRGV